MGVAKGVVDMAPLLQAYMQLSRFLLLCIRRNFGLKNNVMFAKKVFKKGFILEP